MKQKYKASEQLNRVKKLLELYKAGAIPTLAEHEVNPGHPKESRENYLYFTLAPCLNFQRSSPALWASALKTWQDKDTNYLFFPEKVVMKDRLDIQRGLVKHKLALQPNKHTDIWIAICKAFANIYDSDPRELLQRNDFDVPKILETIQKIQKKDFPYLSGPKMTNYWIFILSLYTDAKFKNMQELSIIPDIHVTNCTVHLGLSEERLQPEKVALIWKELLDGSGIAPVEMHPVLWNWSRNNFQPAV